MRNLPRTIEEVRELRGDLSSWLVHLTRDNIFSDQQGKKRFVPAKNCLEQILNQNVLLAANSVGQFNYLKWFKTISPTDLKAVCFTEAPVDEIFLFPHIKHKPLNFSSYGLVFDKEVLSRAPHYVAPVMYFSQPDGDPHYLNVFNLLEQKHCSDFKDVLFLFDKFGKTYVGKDYDFRWEREWRHKGDLANVQSLVRFGLCPEGDISYFETHFQTICFVDPFFSPRQIEHKLRLKGVI